MTAIPSCSRPETLVLPRGCRTIPGSICAPLGFRAGATFCDIKKLGTGKGSDKGRKDDLAIIVSDVPAACAGMFTRNGARAAPVEVCAARLAHHSSARAIVVNSGNANACTGGEGLRDAERMGALTARALRLHKRDVLVCSTGRIGLPLPMRNIERGIRQAAAKIDHSSSSASAVADAIMTSDTRRKEIAVEISVNKTPVRIGGIAKGAGMIAPQMAAPHATMLAFITSDAAIPAPFLQRALAGAVEQSFNRISIDGDMSTNDTVLALANGLAGNSPIVSANCRAFHEFSAALNYVTLELAKMIVRDGEGASRFITLRITGARSEADAGMAARAIANSALVKTSWHGGDPNWGRILCAIGYSGVGIDQGDVEIAYALPKSNQVAFAFRRGMPVRVAFAKLTAITSQPEFDVRIKLGRGKYGTTFYTCELTEDYVAFNKGDINDPDSLGG